MVSEQLGEHSCNDGAAEPVTAYPGRIAPVDQDELVLPRPDVLEVFPGQPEVEAFGPGAFAAQDPERAVAGEEAPRQGVEFGGDAGFLKQLAVSPLIATSPGSWNPPGTS